MNPVKRISLDIYVLEGTQTFGNAQHTALKTSQAGQPKTPRGGRPALLVPATVILCSSGVSSSQLKGHLEHPLGHTYVPVTVVASQL